MDNCIFRVAVQRNKKTKTAISAIYNIVNGILRVPPNNNSGGVTFENV